MLSASSQHTLTRTPNTGNATPNDPPTCTGNPAGDTIPGGAGAALTMSAIGNARIPLLINVPLANSLNPLPVSQNDTYRISPVNPLKGANAPFTLANDPRSATGFTANPVTTI